MTRLPCPRQRTIEAGGRRTHETAAHPASRTTEKKRGKHLQSEVGQVTQTVLQDANHVYVNTLYRKLLGRDADPTGLAADSGLLDAVPAGGNATAARSVVVNAITSSLEYRQDVVDRIFQHYLHRSAFGDPTGLTAFVNLLNAGGTQELVAAAVIGSSEYFMLHGSDTASFLNALYKDGLERAIDPVGANTLLGLAGTNRTAVAQIILNSQEYRAKLVNFPDGLATGGIVASLPFGYYQLLLGRDARLVNGVDESSGYVNELAAGVRDELVFAQIASSQEFFQKVQSG
jgi:hypothetical protein